MPKRASKIHRLRSKRTRLSKRKSATKRSAKKGSRRKKSKNVFRSRNFASLLTSTPKIQTLEDVPPERGIADILVAPPEAHLNADSYAGKKEGEINTWSNDGRKILGTIKEEKDNYHVEINRIDSSEVKQKYKVVKTLWDDETFREQVKEKIEHRSSRQQFLQSSSG